jgi:hypothetical protein
MHHKHLEGILRERKVQRRMHSAIKGIQRAGKALSRLFTVSVYTKEISFCVIQLIFYLFPVRN